MQVSTKWHSDHNRGCRCGSDGTTHLPGTTINRHSKVAERCEFIVVSMNPNGGGIDSKKGKPKNQRQTCHRFTHLPYLFRIGMNVDTGSFRPNLFYRSLTGSQSLTPDDFSLGLAFQPPLGL
jgi:hypothetical protein